MMRKMTIVLALVIALVAAAPVFGAGLDFGGSIETKIEVNKKGEDVTVVPASELSLDLGVTAAQEKVRAGVEFGLKKEKEENGDLMPNDITLGDIVLKQAFIEADGAFWHGGPEATTRFGTLDIGYSPYASLKERSGISVSGIDLEVVGLNGFYGLPGEDGHVLGMRSDLFLLNELAFGASVISDDDIIRLQADAAGEPVAGLQVAGSFAADRTADSGFKMDNLWKVAADYEFAENTRVEAGYKYITSDWVPRYVAAKTKDGDAEHDWIHLAREKDHGVFVNLETAQQGVNMQAAYDQMFAEASIAADTAYEGFNFNVKTVLGVPALSGISTKSTTFGVDRDIEVMDGLAVNAKYEGKWTGGPEGALVHTVGATTTLGIVPAINGLELSAEVSASELKFESVGYKVGAEFAAPNGVNLGVEHARDTGTTFNAGMKVEF